MLAKAQCDVCRCLTSVCSYRALCDVDSGALQCLSMSCIFMPCRRHENTIFVVVKPLLYDADKCYRMRISSLSDYYAMLATEQCDVTAAVSPFFIVIAVNFFAFNCPTTAIHCWNWQNLILVAVSSVTSLLSKNIIFHILFLLCHKILTTAKTMCFAVKPMTYDIGNGDALSRKCHTMLRTIYFGDQPLIYYAAEGKLVYFCCPASVKRCWQKQNMMIVTI